MKNKLLLLLLFLWTATTQSQTLPLQLPEGTGILRLGLACGEESRWLDQCKVKNKGNYYTIEDKLWKGGKVELTICSLTDTQGIIIKATAENLPPDTRLCWAFGACEDKAVRTEQDDIIPTSACHDNVFCIEGNTFTVYYGEVMKLRTVHGVMPDSSEPILCDAHQQNNPLTLYRSGKKTDAPVIAALRTWQGGETLYFCLYKQNTKADYNRFMLPPLFDKEIQNKQ